MADPGAVAEIRRILLLNLGIRENRPSAVGVKVELPSVFPVSAKEASPYNIPEWFRALQILGDPG